MYKEIGFGHVVEIYRDGFDQRLKLHVDLLRDLYVKFNGYHQKYA